MWVMKSTSAGVYACRTLSAWAAAAVEYGVAWDGGADDAAGWGAGDWAGWGEWEHAAALSPSKRTAEQRPGTRVNIRDLQGMRTWQYDRHQSGVTQSAPSGEMARKVCPGVA
jgi:hypothetical protein